MPAPDSEALVRTWQGSYSAALVSLDSAPSLAIGGGGVCSLAQTRWAIKSRNHAIARQRRLCGNVDHFPQQQLRDRVIGQQPAAWLHSGTRPATRSSTLLAKQGGISRTSAPPALGSTHGRVLGVRIPMLNSNWLDACSLGRFHVLPGASLTSRAIDCTGQHRGTVSFGSAARQPWNRWCLCPVRRRYSSPAPSARQSAIQRGWRREGTRPSRPIPGDLHGSRDSAATEVTTLGAVARCGVARYGMRHRRTERHSDLLLAFPMHRLGLEGMPRRVYTDLPEMGCDHPIWLASRLDAA